MIFTYGIWFNRIEIDSKIIKCEQVGPDICHFIDLGIAIGGHFGNMQIKNCHWVKFSTPDWNDDSSLYWTQITQNINFCMNFQVISALCLTTTQYFLYTCDKINTIIKLQWYLFCLFCTGSSFSNDTCCPLSHRTNCLFFRWYVRV